MTKDNFKKIKEIYQFGRFRLDATERRLWHDEESIKLTPKQFDLLFYLVENAGRVAKKNELLDAIWADTFVEETTLARNVSSLRKILGESIIETVPKLGYRFTAEVTQPEENLIIIEEQTVQHFRREEIITFDDAELTRNKELKSAKSAGYLTKYTLPILLIALGLIIGGGFFFYRNQKTPQVVANTQTQANQLNVKATITVKNITVDATREFVDVGLKIQPGDVIRVSAMGIFQTEGEKKWTFQGESKGEIYADHTFQKADPWSLVAWIGTEADKNDYFQASTNPVFQSSKSGALYLAVNDLLNNYSDNRGGLNVAVVLYRQYDIYAEEDDVEMAWGKELVNIRQGDRMEIRSRGNVAYWQNGELYDLNGSDHSTEGHLAPELNARSFIGKIGDNPAFKAGTDFPAQKINIGGYLFLSVNDKISNKSGSFTNNSGEITTDVEVIRQPEELKYPI